MSLQLGGQQSQTVLYQADQNWAENLKNIRHKLHYICKHYANHTVRIVTLDGQTFVGRIVNCNNGLLQLAVPSYGGPRAFFGSPFYNSDELILTLVLYELLVITLLYT
ncbi:hypothetical protein FRY98_12015 [Paenibacillus faecis]|uniref:Uncharacterized protein n=1 Tax=Paenibacillus faecis TaxID=862114 RepID=A0A5D0CU20_9BACL|nr:hypothetical protein [Paenibacillus faecis]TYA13383.1 hypothetical protein FRY98_12015 [Paenibacillus faecis]